MERPKNLTNEQWRVALSIYNSAKKQGDKFPELTVAQAALETGWFKHKSGKNNYFGQKATQSQKGTSLTTTEVANNKYYKTKQKFRDYESIDEAMSDRVKKWSSKYSDAKTPDEALSKIWRYDKNKGTGVGYATDIKYGEKIKSILGSLGTALSDSEPIQETEEQAPYINPIDFNTPEYSGMTFSEEEAPQAEQTPQQASQDLLEESFLEEADAILTQQEQPIQEYAPAPQYNVELAPIEYQPIAQFQDGGELPDPVNGITYDPNGTRTHYDSRLDRIVLTPQSAFAPKNAVINHEKFHKKQYDSGRSNFDIAHSTENKLWAQMQKPPQLMTTDEEYYNYHNRKSIESNIDIDNLKKLNSDFRFVPKDILYDKIVDPQQYSNPYSLEGEATEYENSKFQSGGELEIKDSIIQGKGIFTKDFFKKGDLIGLTHTNSQPSTELGKFHNHSENPNTESLLIGDKRFLFAKKDINKNKEITVDYKKQPELEQPNNFR